MWDSLDEALNKSNVEADAKQIQQIGPDPYDPCSTQGAGKGTDTQKQQPVEPKNLFTRKAKPDNIKSYVSVSISANSCD